MKGRVRAALCDLDGTLIDTAEDIAAAVNRMLRDLGRPPMPVREVALYIGKGIPMLVRRVLARRLDTAEVPADYERALALFETYYAEESGRSARVYPQVVEGLKRMRAAGVRLACVTNKAERYTIDLLKRAGLAEYFQVVVSGDTLPQKKPDPAPLRYACECLGVAPEESVVIGDSLNDVQAARNAGIHVMAVPYGYNEGRPVETLHPDLIVADLVAAAEQLGAPVVGEARPRV